MDNETILKHFGEIEHKIDHLLTINKSLESDNLELKERIQALESELQQKIESENQSNEVRTLIKTRIDSLMERLDGIAEA